MKKILPLLVAILVTVPSLVMAQEAPVHEPPRVSPLVFEPLFYLALLVGVLLLLTFYTLFRAVQALSHRVAPPPPPPVAVPADPESLELRPTAWDRLMNKLTRSVPVTKEKDILLDHNYDGIRELDNELPPWWKWGFYVTIFFAGVYMVYYHGGGGKLQLAEYNEELNQAKLAMELRMQDARNNITEENVAALSGADELAAGKTIFAGNCVTCHGALAQGTETAPNLTDPYWLHGGGIRDIFRTITKGVPGKAMISWSQKLSPRQINEVSSYILSLQGSQPDGAKQPEGDLFQGGSSPVSSQTPR